MWVWGHGVGFYCISLGIRAIKNIFEVTFVPNSWLTVYTLLSDNRYKLNLRAKQAVSNSSKIVNISLIVCHVF